MAKLQRTCDIEGCDRRHYAKGMCQYHYNASLPRKVYVSGECAFDGCWRPVNSHGLCASHDRQRRLGRDLRPVAARLLIVDGKKECGDCGEMKPLSEFPKQRHRCKDCASINNRVRLYGITRELAEMLLRSTTCWVCGDHVEGKRKHVDHDHATGKIRGVLCEDCNLVLGRVKDDPVRLRALADYLERNAR